MTERDGGGASGGGESARSDEGRRPAALLREHHAVLARVAMALLGDAAEVERTLESVAREAAAGPPLASASPAPSSSATPDPTRTGEIAWLLGLVRAACATQLSRGPLLRRTPPPDASPATLRIGAVDAGRARSLLSRLRPTEREAVVLSLVGGLSSEEVATACSVDLGTAKTRIARGIEQLVRETETPEATDEHRGGTQPMARPMTPSPGSGSSEGGGAS